MDNILNEPAPASQKAFYTVAEYLEMEKTSDTKHELFREKCSLGLGREENTTSFLKMFQESYMSP